MHIYRKIKYYPTFSNEDIFFSIFFNSIMFHNVDISYISINTKDVFLTANEHMITREKSLSIIKNYIYKYIYIIT